MKSAIVGCGGIGAVHARALKSMDCVESIIFADIRPERAQNYAELAGGRFYGCLEEMLDAEKIDILHICTPHYLHVPMALAAAQRGIAVFLEKPAAVTPEEYARLKEKTKNIPLGICFQNRYNPSVQYLKARLDSGEWGAVKGARAFVTWHRDKDYYESSFWRGGTATEGGGVLINQSLHTLDLLNYFLGEPVKVCADSANYHLSSDITIEDTLNAYLEFAETTACFYATTAFCKDAPVMIEIVCENATVRMEETEVSIYRDGRIEHRSFVNGEKFGKSAWGSSHHACIADFYESVQQKRPFALNLNAVDTTMNVMFKIYEQCGRKY